MHVSGEVFDELCDPVSLLASQLRFLDRFDLFVLRYDMSTVRIDQA